MWQMEKQMELDGDFLSKWIVAWRQLDICYMGWLERLLSGDRDRIVWEETEGTEQRMEEMGENVGNLLAYDDCLDFLQSEYAG